MWILINSTFILVAIIYLKKLYKSISKLNRKKFKSLQALPNYYQKTFSDNKTIMPNTFLVHKLKCKSKKNIFKKSSMELNLTDNLQFDLCYLDELSKGKILFLSFENNCKNLGKNRYAVKISRPFKIRSQKKKRYDITKQILQNIRIQFIVIFLFILCLSPLFLAIVVDTKFQLISYNIYRVLSIIAFTTPCLTPFCYITILFPMINKCCFKFLRTGTF